MGNRPLNSSLFSVLRHRDFRFLWIGNLISSCGVWMQNLAQGWLILNLSNSPLLLGLLGFASLFPVLVLSLIGGTIADRSSRRTILILTQSGLMLLAFTLAALTSLGLITAWHIIAISLMTGVATALNSPAYQAMIPDLVPKEELTQAIALNSLQFNSARIIGHSVAGVAVATVGVAGCFYLNGFSYLVLLYALFSLSIPSRHITRDTIPFWERLRDGLVHVRKHRDLTVLIMTMGAISFLGLPYFFLLPIFGRDVLGTGAKGLGYLTASVSMGALTGALLMSRVTHRVGKRRVIVTCGLLFWIGLIGFSISRNYYLSFSLLIAVGFNLVMTLSTANNILQVLTAPEMRGRVMSMSVMAVSGLAPIGTLLAGVIASKTSAPIAIGSMCVFGLLLTAAVLTKLSDEIA